LWGGGKGSVGAGELVRRSGVSAALAGGGGMSGGVGGSARSPSFLGGIAAASVSGGLGGSGGSPSFLGSVGAAASLQSNKFKGVGSVVASAGRFCRTVGGVSGGGAPSFEDPTLSPAPVTVLDWNRMRESSREREEGGLVGRCARAGDSVVGSGEGALARFSLSAVAAWSGGPGRACPVGSLGCMPPMSRASTITWSAGAKGVTSSTRAPHI